jgi:hypothetical protein
VEAAGLIGDKFRLQRWFRPITVDICNGKAPLKASVLIDKADCANVTQEEKKSNRKAESLMDMVDHE